MEEKIDGLANSITSLILSFLQTEVGEYRENYEYMLNSPLCRKLLGEIDRLKKENQELSSQERPNIELEIMEEVESPYNFDRKYKSDTSVSSKFEQIKAEEEVPQEEEEEVEETEEEVEETEQPDVEETEEEVEETEEEAVSDGSPLEEEEEEEEEEVFEFEYRGVMYFATDEVNGVLYACVDDDIGDEVGKIENKNVILY